MTNKSPPCPECNSTYSYEDRGTFICPEFSHEWSGDASSEPDSGQKQIIDANVNVLRDGDSVTAIKDLKTKGSSGVIKVSTKVKSIRLVEGDHDIDCKIEGIGAMKLKSQFVKKRRFIPCSRIHIASDNFTHDKNTRH